MADGPGTTQTPAAVLGDPLFARALMALDAAAVRYELRKPPDVAARGGVSELDLWLSSRDVPRAEEALRRAGFQRLRARGQGAHRFFVALDAGRWAKLDVKLRDARESRLASARLAGRLPLSARRQGPVVAVLGPDGAGKGTLVAELRRRIPFEVRTSYLGGGASGREHVADRASKPIAVATTPETGGRATVAGGANSGGAAGAAEAADERLPRLPRETAFLLWQVLKAWRRLLPVYAAAWRGAVVLCDRHPIEVLAIRPERRPLAMRLEAALARVAVPRPDAIVVLDAPAATLLRRKGEHSAEILERWRDGFREVFAPAGAVFVSTTSSRELSVARASDVVWDALAQRRGWPRASRAGRRDG